MSTVIESSVLPELAARNGVVLPSDEVINFALHQLPTDTSSAPERKVTPHDADHMDLRAYSKAWNKAGGTVKLDFGREQLP